MHSSSYSVSEFFDAREYTTDAGDDSDLDSTEDEDIDDDEEDDEEAEFVDNETMKGEDSNLRTSLSRDDSDIVPVCNLLDFQDDSCLAYKYIQITTFFECFINTLYLENLL